MQEASANFNDCQALKMAITRLHGKRSNAFRREGVGYRVWRIDNKERGLK